MKKLVVSMIALMMAATMLAGCTNDDNGSGNDVGDTIESTIDDAGSIIDEGMDDVSKAVEDVESMGR